MHGAAIPPAQRDRFHYVSNGLLPLRRSGRDMYSLLRKLRRVFWTTSR